MALMLAWVVGQGIPDVNSQPVSDTDGDGVFDTRDVCPQQPEDIDGFEDGDGCPDVDNDADGVLDLKDKCPNIPGVADNHGCPPHRCRLPVD